MRKDVFTQALIATARIACCAALLACDLDKEDIDCTTDTAAQAADTGAVDCTIDTEEDTVADTWEECEPVVIADFSDDTISGETAECCQVIADHYSEAMKTDGAAMDDWSERSECCELLEWQGSLACTPWGPPCPPASGDFSRQQTIARVEAVRQAALT